MSYYIDDTVTVHHGDCLDVLATLPDASVDAVVTDPPYGLGFMGKEWDDLPPGRPWAEQCLRVLKPGGHLLAFGGTRTSHRLACAVEDAGFEIRDSIAWLYGSGFPKSLNVALAIDKSVGATGNRGQGINVAGVGTNANYGTAVSAAAGNLKPAYGEAATDAARTWQGWGTALKPAHEPIVVARKPLSGTVAANVLEHGVGALNVDGCRIGTEGGRTVHTRSAGKDRGQWEGNEWTGEVTLNGGRWPANVVLDETQAAALDQQSGELASGNLRPYTNRSEAEYRQLHVEQREVNRDGDSGGASRFFYTAKADAAERVRIDGTAHPTVKPLALMRWLVRLVTPSGGTVLEPFAGSGTTVEACILEGFRCVAIEREADYLPLILQRIHRRRDPVAAVKATAEDGGLFDLLEEDEPA